MPKREYRVKPELFAKEERTRASVSTQSASNAGVGLQTPVDDDARFRPPTTGENPSVHPTAAFESETTQKAGVPKVLAPRKRVSTTVIIGFDFGTHSTKVVCRERRPNSNEADIIVFDREAKGYPPTASPSLVRVDNNRLYFGTEALARSTGVLYRSLKVELIPGFQRPASDFPENASAVHLIAAYLTWAFQQVRENLGEFESANKLLNISAPMDHFESKRLKKKYLQIVQAAWKLSFDDVHYAPMRQGISIDEANAAIDPLLQQPPESEATRAFGVMPETIAPIVSVSLDPLSKPGLYAVVDMGAATTEVSIFHLGDDGFDQKVVCYQDTTKLMGGNDLHATDSGSQRVIASLEKQFTKTWFSGFQIDSKNPHARRRWEELTILQSGGGTLDPSVRTFLAKFNPKKFWEDQGDLLGPVDRDRHIPSEISTTRGAADQTLSLYAVANGLAIDEMNWPEIHDDIEPIETPEDEAKPQGYWYLDD